MVKLVVIWKDLYLVGFRNNSQSLFACSIAKYINPDVFLPFENTYAGLGYDRAIEYRLGIKELNLALTALSNANVEAKDLDQYRKHFLHLTIGFCEAIRFADVVDAIINGKPVPDLDWKKRAKNGTAQVIKPEFAKS